MTPEQETSKPYMKHRENQRQRILEAAEPLFIEHGIDGVNLSDIAREARLTRSTVYEYFADKTEIAWAILDRIFEEGRLEFAGQPEAGAYQRLESFMMGMVQGLDSRRDHLRFIVEFNSLYARESGSERMIQATGRDHTGHGSPVRIWLEQGIADGTLRTDIEPALCTAAIWNLLSGMNARFALLGSQVHQEYGLSPIAIYQEICQTFLRGIKHM